MSENLMMIEPLLDPANNRSTANYAHVELDPMSIASERVSRGIGLNVGCALSQQLENPLEQPAK